MKAPSNEAFEAACKVLPNCSHDGSDNGGECAWCDRKLSEIAYALDAYAEQAVKAHKRAADVLADEVAALVLRKVIDSRSPAADALLDYRNPPSTPRDERLAERDRAVAEQAVKAEREACAKIADAPSTQSSKAVARLIRARGGE